MPSGKEIKSTQRRERRILIELDSAGLIVAGGEHATAVDNGVGDHTLTLTNPAARAITGGAYPLVANCAVYLESGTVSTIDVKITDLAAAAADLAVLVEIIAWDSVDEI